MVKAKTECNDEKCPIHGKANPRGREFKGVVLSVGSQKSAVVGWDWSKIVRKYERYEKKRTRVSVHNAPCINAKKGDKVLIKECRPLSKTKKFAIIKITSKEELFAEKERLLEEGKVKTKEEKKAEEKPKYEDSSEKDKVKE